MQQFRNYVNGQWLSSERLFDNINPADESLIGQVHEASAAQVDQAVAAARDALAGEWGRLTEPQRASLLAAVADAIAQRFDDFVAAEVADTGKPASLARTVDVPRAVANFRSFAELVQAYPDEAYHSQAPDASRALNYTHRRPLGVVGIIAPWNLPLLLLTWKLAPALAAGNTVLVKPSEETPASATLLAEVMQQAGMPPGVFNLLHGFGADSAGAYIAEHSGIDGITFTGESATGAAIMRAAAPGVKPLSFELGGKNAALVFADCDLEAALDGVARAVFMNSGQVCMCTERVLVAQPIFASFVAGLVERAQALQLGAPYDEGVTTGPLISRAHQDKVLNYYRLAEGEGAEVLVGGSAPVAERQRGYFVQPTIWSGLDDSSRVNREEVFGPCCHIAAFASEDEAIARANSSDYGLCASIWTQNLARAHRVARQMEVGIVWVNSWYLRDLRTAFGGSKLSGLGREGGLHSLNFYSELSNVCIHY